MDETLRQMIERQEEKEKKFNEMMENVKQEFAEYVKGSTDIVKRMKEMLNAGFAESKKSVIEVLEAAPANIGKTVMVRENIDSEKLEKARSICRRKFNAEDVLLLVLLGRYTQENGLVFTDNALYYYEGSLSEGNYFRYAITYENIANVDYESDEVEIQTTDGQTFKIEDVYCHRDSGSSLLGSLGVALGEFEYCGENMYNFLMDIVDALKQA